MNQRVWPVEFWPTVMSMTFVVEGVVTAGMGNQGLVTVSASYYLLDISLLLREVNMHWSSPLRRKQ